MKKLMHKLIANSLRFTKEGYVEVSVMPGIDESQYGGEGGFAERPDTPVALVDGSHDASAADAGKEETAETAAPKQSKITEEDIRDDRITIVLEDTGEGMTSSFLHEQLFAPFQKADQFKAGAGLSMTLCASLVRKLKGRMHITSDVGRGTVVTVTIPVKHQRGDITPNREIPPSNVDRLVYLYGFEGQGMQRLAQAISAQLATFGNFYTTTSIADCDYILLPEEKVLQTDGGAEAVLSKCRRGVKVGVLQAHEDAGIERAAWLHRSAGEPVYVTRKPFGPKAFAALLGAYTEGAVESANASGERKDSTDYFSLGRPSAIDKADNKRASVGSSSSGSGYAAAVGRMDGQALVGAASASKGDGGDGESPEIETESVEAKTADDELHEAAANSKHRGRGILPDLMFVPRIIDEILRAPQPYTPLLPRRKISTDENAAGVVGAAVAEANKAAALAGAQGADAPGGGGGGVMSPTSPGARIQHGLTAASQSLSFGSSTILNFFQRHGRAFQQGAGGAGANASATSSQAGTPGSAAGGSTAEQNQTQEQQQKQQQQQQASQSQAAPAPPPFEEEQFSVLVVEDNPLNARVVGQMLKQSHVLQFAAADGLEAVERFKEHAPTIVLLDINMPRMNGFDAW